MVCIALINHNPIAAVNKKGEKMKIAKEKDIDDILFFLKNNIANCLYMYIDIKKYGLQNPNMTVWISRDASDNQVNLVVMKYYDSIQMFSDNKQWDKEWLTNLILKEKYSMVSGEAQMIRQLEELLRGEYHSEYGEIFRLPSYRKTDDTDIVQYAREADMEEIAELICMDESFKANYQPKILEKQLKERLLSGMGRNAIIRDNKRIVAHIATYAEFEDIAITSGLIVHPEYRTSSYGFIVESVLTNDLLDLGKFVYTFALEKKRKQFLAVLGARVCGEYGKLTRDGEISDEAK